ncbi:methyltransferase [Streptomyces sp. NPDC001933]|uniref:methyltransferase n=1 Tax=Streptomyces sp. NPDC001933 TaxID=3364626 RepID=UPI0036C6F531
MSSQDAVLTKFREYTLGPLRFMNLLSCFELGIVDSLKEDRSGGLTAAQIAEKAGVTPSAAEQLLHLMVKEDFVSFDETASTYALDGLRDLTDEDLARVIPWMNMVKEVCLRQLYHLSDSVRTGTVVGLKELFDFDGNFYEASTRHPELQASWGAMMDQVTDFIDPWFYDQLDVGKDTKILDLAGNTGLGAILAYRHKGVKGAENLQVTCFDFPEKEAEARENFREHGVEENCSFIGGDVFQGLPKGFDTIMIKHFLDMFDKENVYRIFQSAHDALEVGGQVYVLVPIHPEDVKVSNSVDFFPAYMLGCTMAQGGPQKISTYEQWMEACGFKVTKAISQDISTMPPDVIPVHGIICGTKMPS